MYITKAGVKFLREKDKDEEEEEEDKKKDKTPQNLKGKALAAYLRQKDIEGLGFRGPMGRG